MEAKLTTYCLSRVETVGEIKNKCLRQILSQLMPFPIATN